MEQQSSAGGDGGATPKALHWTHTYEKWDGWKMKIPLVAFYGAFGLIPYRRKMKMVIGRPIMVEKANSDVTDDQAQELCDEVQASVLKLYEDHKPAWETRSIRFER